MLGACGIGPEAAHDSSLPLHPMRRRILSSAGALSALTLLVCLGSAAVRDPQAALADNARLSVRGSVDLAPGGDREGNGTIDGGDTVTLTFAVRNDGEVPVTFATLRTPLDSRLLHGLWNLRGATGYLLQDDVLSFPNLNAPPHAGFDIQIDATVDYAAAEGVITLDPEIVDDAGRSLLSARGGGLTKRITGGWKGRLPSLLRRRIHDSSSSAR